MDLRAVIFDLDGVLTHTSKYHARAWTELVRSLGLSPPEDLEERVKGVSRLESLAIALGSGFERYTPEEREALADRKTAIYLQAVKGLGPDDLLPGAARLLDGLKADGILVVLGSASKNARSILDGLGITDRFNVIADGHAFTHSKPHPDVFLTAARLAGVTPAECIVVEDAAVGVTAALDGGFVAVGIGTYESLRHSHLFVQSLTELDAAQLRNLHVQYRADLWTVARSGYHGEREPSLHTLFAVGNGRLGVRGWLPELPAAGEPGLFLAGFYGKLTRPPQDPAKWPPFMHYWGAEELAAEDRIEACIVNCPDFLAMAWEAGGEKLDLLRGDLISLERRLDLRTGVFSAEAHWRSPGGRELKLTQRRFADLERTERIYSQYVLEPINFSAALTISAGIMATAHNHSEIGSERLYEVTGTSWDGCVASMRVRGKAGGMEAAFATAVRLPGRPGTSWTGTESPEGITAACVVPLVQGELLYLERFSAVADARREAEPLAAAVASVHDALRSSFGEARVKQSVRWREYWRDSDIRIEGGDFDQLGARFSIYHGLVAAAWDGAGVCTPPGP